MTEHNIYTVSIKTTFFNIPIFILNLKYSNSPNAWPLISFCSQFQYHFLLLISFLISFIFDICEGLGVDSWLMLALVGSSPDTL